MTKRSPAYAYLILIISLVIGVYLLTDGITGCIETSRNKNACTEKTSAKVVSTEERSVGSGTHQHMEYRAGLKIPNRSYILISAWSKKKFTENSTIEILYAPSSPDNIYIPSNPPYAEREARVDIIFGGTGIVCGIILFVSEKRRR